MPQGDWSIVYLNRDPFAVRTSDYFAKVEEAKGDWTLVAEWIEFHGVLLNGQAPRNQSGRLPFDGRETGLGDSSATDHSVSHLPECV